MLLLMSKIKFKPFDEVETNVCYIVSLLVSFSCPTSNTFKDNIYYLYFKAKSVFLLILITNINSIPIPEMGSNN